MSATPRTNTEAERTGGAGFWIGAVIGIGIMAFGVKGLLDAAPATRPSQVAFGFLGLDLLHDFVVAPIVCLIGIVLVGRFPRWVRAPLRAGLFASIVAFVVGWAALRGYGRDRVPDNATVDPLNYSSAVLTVLAVIWVAAGLWVVGAWLARSRAAAREVESPV